MDNDFLIIERDGTITIDFQERDVTFLSVVFVLIVFVPA